LIPVANKPILFYAIEDLIECGIREIGIIVGPNRGQVMETVNNVRFDAEITFIEQDEPRGLAHAVLISEEFIGDELFVMYLGDNILKGGITKYLKIFRESNSDAGILLCPVGNPSQFGCAELNEDGSVKKLLEKPKEPPSNLALVGVYFFREAIFEAAKNIKPSRRNELEITDAIQYLIDNSFKVHSAIVSEWWKDTGKPEDILDANRMVLDDLNSSTEGEINGEMRGRVSIGEGTKVNDKSVIKGPVLIGRGCVIKNSYIGPYTSIGNSCEIINSEVEDSVVMADVRIINAGNIVDSIIGRGAVIERNKILPKGSKFVIGDNSWVRIG
jgi:glucose-1-phosphate thymidylyltransferase